MTLATQVTALALPLAFTVYVAFKAYKTIAMSRHRDVGPQARYGQLSMFQLKKLAARSPDQEAFRPTSVGSLFKDAIDQTLVVGLIGHTTAAYIPTDANRIAMFDNRRIVLCLSADKRTMIVQELEPDNRYWVHFMHCAGGGNLEQSYQLLSDIARDAKAHVPLRERL